MNRCEPLDLATLVGMFVELSLSGCTAIIRVPEPQPEVAFAFLVFRRRWPVGRVVCQFVGRQADNA